MATASLKARVAALETEVARLKTKVESGKPSGDPWIEDVRGAFADDPIFVEAMRLGSEYRKAQQRKSKVATRARSK